HNPAYYGQHSAYRWEISKREEVDEKGETVFIGTRIEREVGERRVVLANAAPKLIDKEVVQAIMDRLRAKQLAASRNNKHPEIALLRGGFVKCAKCGKSLHVSYIGRSGASFPVYRCGHTRYSSNTASKTPCQGTSITVERMDNTVWAFLLKKLQNPEELMVEAEKNLAAHSYTDTIEGIAQHIEELTKEQRRLDYFVRKLDPTDPEDAESLERLQFDMRKLGKEKREAKDKIAKLERKQREVDAARQRMHTIAEWGYGVEQASRGNMNYDEKR